MFLRVSEEEDKKTIVSGKLIHAILVAIKQEVSYDKACNAEVKIKPIELKQEIIVINKINKAEKEERN